MRKILGAAITVGLLCSACSIYGPNRVMHNGGVAESISNNFDNANHRQVVQRFVILARRAYRIGFITNDSGVITSVSAQDSITTAANQDIIHRFASEGFALISLNCSDYLTILGNRQRRANVFRDSIGPIAALITGIVGIAAPGGGENGVNAVGQDWLSGIALGSAFLNSGLDIYDQRFLFGAENIHSVRQLTIRALARHAADSTYHTPRNGTPTRRTLTFADATRQLRDNQELCTPAAILELARSSIASGRLRAIGSRDGSDETPPERPAPGDENWNPAALRELLGDQASRVTDEQMEAIFANLPAAPNAQTLRAAIEQRAPDVDLGLSEAELGEIATTIGQRAAAAGGDFFIQGNDPGTRATGSDIPPPESFSVVPSNGG